MESRTIAVFCWESMYAERVGGLANAATHLAETLARQGHGVHFFTRGSVHDQTIHGVHYHYCQPRGNNIVEYCDNMSNAMVAQFREVDHGEHFDILHFHDWHPVQALHQLKDRATVLTFHSTEWGRSGNHVADSWIYREISGKEGYGALIAKKVTAVSVTMRKEVMQLYKVPEGKCEVVPNGIVPGEFRTGADPGDIRRAYGIPPFAPLILFIGRLEYQKGPDLLIEAVRQFARHRPDARVIVAGEGGMRHLLEERARGLPVRFTGYVPDAEYVRLLNACDFVVIPSRNEPFGLVLLEAWSAGKGVVASDVGGLGENIDAFVNGVKCDASPDALAWGMGMMVDEPWNAGALGTRGRKKVDRVFRWEPIAEKMAGTYARVVA